MTEFFTKHHVKLASDLFLRAWDTAVHCAPLETPIEIRLLREHLKLK